MAVQRGCSTADLPSARIWRPTGSAFMATAWRRFFREPGRRCRWWSLMQLAALVAVRAYARRPRVDWLLRVLAGVALGTAAAVALIGLSMGFEGISRSAFLADAMLLAIAAVGWRAVWVLRARAKARAQALASGVDLTDRSAEMTHAPGGRAEPLQIPRAAQEPRPQRYQAEVSRLGVWLSLVAGQSPADDGRVYGGLHVHPADSERGLRLLLDARPALVDVFCQLCGHVDGSDRRQLRAPQERPLSAGDSSHRDGAVQPRTVLADRIRFPAGHDDLVRDRAVRIDDPVSRVSRASGRADHRRRLDPLDGDGLLPRRSTPARSRARRHVLDDADRL